MGNTRLSGDLKVGSGVTKCIKIMDARGLLGNAVIVKKAPFLRTFTKMFNVT